MLSPGAFERRLASAGSLSLLVFFVFFVMLAYWQALRTDLADEDRNPRVLSAFYDPGRGNILDRDGNIIAESLGDGTRYYHDASVAHAVGYLDPRYGSQGIELVFNQELTGQRPTGWSGAFSAEFERNRLEGNDIRLTIDPEVQAAAARALGARKGAVIAIDPRSGDVLAMVSVPTYDPGGLGTVGDALFNDPDAPLLNRATQGLYPPGSTFKTVTAVAALGSGVITPETLVECPGEIVIDGFPISCRNVPQGVGTYPFRDAYTFSVNAIFAEVGVKAGWERLLRTARSFGFERPLDFTLETAASQVYAPGSELSRVLLASTAFGQGEILATPLQMALVAATIANGGQMALPRLTLGASDKNNQLVRELEHPAATRVIDATLARTMREFMVSVVENGQAGGVTIPGVSVAGKTGTAEAGDGTSHAWFIAFAPAEEPEVAVAVVVESGGQGGVVASPVAGSVIRAVLDR